MIYQGQQMANLKPFHSFHISAQAKQIIEIQEIAQLQQQWALAQAQDLPVVMLGEGSNVLFLQDFNGVVLLNRLLGKEHTEDPDYHYLHVAGGENWHHLVQWSLQQGIYGLENLALIPGCVGSAPIQNIGAYGVEFKNLCAYVDVLDLAKGEIFRLRNRQCEFAYRDSVFKHQYKQGYVIVAVGLTLRKNWQPRLHYGKLREFDENTVTAQQVFDTVCEMRRSKLPDPAQLGNAGSFFKNPIVSNTHFRALIGEYPDMPHFQQLNGDIKLAAGWLIEQCGLKGYQVGGASVHQQQALVIVNHADASASDVVELAHHIRQKVAQRFAVWLQPEVRFIGANGEVDSEQLIS